MSRVIVIVAVVGLIWAAPQLAAQRLEMEEQERILQQAAAAYDAGDYPVAAAVYRQLLDMGWHDPAVYFNLGNAYLQAGDIGQALVYYLRARERLPRDADLEANIARARAMRMDVFSDGGDLLADLAEATTGLLSIRELGWLALLFWTALFGGLSLRRWFKWENDILRYGFLAIFGMFLLSAILLGSRLLIDWRQPVAVVTREQVTVMSGPGVNYLPYFDLHSGAELRILETRDNWLRFVLPDGRQGWLAADAVTRV